MKSQVAVSAVAVSILTTTLASASTSSYFQYVDQSKGSYTGYCSVHVSTLSEVYGDSSRLEIGGMVRKLNKIGDCPDILADDGVWGYVNEPVYYAISYTLIKWDGTNQVVCGTDPGYPGWEQDWVNNGSYALYSATFSGTTPGVRALGCGPGWYNAYVRGYYHDSSGWVGGGFFSGWGFYNLTERVVPK